MRRLMTYNLEISVACVLLWYLFPCASFASPYLLCVHTESVCSPPNSLYTCTHTAHVKIISCIWMWNWPCVSLIDLYLSISLSARAVGHCWQWYNLSNRTLHWFLHCLCFMLWSVYFLFVYQGGDNYYWPTKVSIKPAKDREQSAGNNEDELMV